MFRKLFFLLIALSSFGTVTADSIFVDAGVAYKIIDANTVNIVEQQDRSVFSQTFKDSVLVVPASIQHNGKNYKVKCIEKGAFSPWWGMNRVVISEGIEEIQDDVFTGCANLQSVSIPASVRKIGGNVFSYCYSLSSIVVDDHNPIYDSRNGCNAVILTKSNSLVSACKSTVIPSSVEEIRSDAYVGLPIEAINIPVGVIHIREYAFNNCKELERIFISSSVENIEPNAFCECENVKSVRVDEKNETYDSRENCNAIIDKVMETLVWGCSTTRIPSGVTEIGEYAFQYSTNLQEIDIPEGVESIRNAAFLGCSALRKVKLPSSLTEFDRFEQFAYCTSLDSIYIPQNVETISSGIFCGCTSLRNVVVDKRNKKYDSRDNCNAVIETSTNELIAGCTGSSIVEGVESIVEGAFSRCGITAIHIPASVTQIGSTSFSGCEQCRIITVADGNPIYKSDGSNSIVERATHRMVLACSTTRILPDVTSIGPYAYMNTSYNIVLPSGIQTIGYGAFMNSNNLSTIIIPTSVKRIGGFAFGGCRQLSNVVLMGNDVVIGERAFDRCTLLKQEFK